MRKIVFVLLAVTLLFGTFAVAQTHPSATGAPIAITAVVPEFVGFTSQSVTELKFDASTFAIFNAEQLAGGWSDVSTWVHNGFLPSWTLRYNLSGKPTLTVCAYSTDLLPASGHAKIPATALYGTSLNLGGSQHFGTRGCGQPNAFLLDSIKAATINHGLVEGFGEMGILLPVDMTPGTFRGTLNIVAQVL